MKSKDLVIYVVSLVSICFGLWTGAKLHQHYLETRDHTFLVVIDNNIFEAEHETFTYWTTESDNLETLLFKLTVLINEKNGFYQTWYYVIERKGLDSSYDYSITLKHK